MTTRQKTSLDAIIGLTSYDGVDSRPTLLRVLTDLYVQKPSHSLEEERHYTELALRLVDVVDLPTRKAIAERLVRYPAAPLSIIKRLARDISEFSKLQLPKAAEGSHAATPAPTAQPVASLPPPTRAPVRPVAQSRPALTDTPRPGTLTARLFGDKAAAKSSTTAVPASVAPVAPSRPLATPTAATAASQPTAATPAETPLVVTLGIIERLESAALEGRPDRFIRELEHALQLSRATAQHAVNDVTGEQVVYVCRALDMPLDMLQRVLLFLNPAVGRSVERVYMLSGMFQEIRPDYARQVVAGWRVQPAAATAAKGHQPTLWDDERRSARETSTTAPRRLATPTALPARERAGATPGPVKR